MEYMTLYIVITFDPQNNLSDREGKPYPSSANKEIDSEKYITFSRS